jgi:hypothetical protein
LTTVRVTTSLRRDLRLQLEGVGRSIRIMIGYGTKGREPIGPTCPIFAFAHIADKRRTVARHLIVPSGANERET